jgi:hypothetical protein
LRYPNLLIHGTGAKPKWMIKYRTSSLLILIPYRWCWYIIVSELMYPRRISHFTYVLIDPSNEQAVFMGLDFVSTKRGHHVECCLHALMLNSLILVDEVARSGDGPGNTWIGRGLGCISLTREHRDDRVRTLKKSDSQPNCQSLGNSLSKFVSKCPEIMFRSCPWAGTWNQCHRSLCGRNLPLHAND